MPIAYRVNSLAVFRLAARIQKDVAGFDRSQSAVDAVLLKDGACVSAVVFSVTRATLHTEGLPTSRALFSSLPASSPLLAIISTTRPIVFRRP
jgi:hypothetical protein